MKKFIYGLFSLLFLMVGRAAADYSFTVPLAKVIYLIDSDGYVTISYEYLIENHGQPLDFIDIGMPNNTYNLADVEVVIDEEPLDTSRLSFASTEETGLNYGVTVDISDRPVRSGEMIDFFIAVPLIERQLYRLDGEESEPERVSFNFQPNYFSDSFVRGKTKMGVRLYLPEGLGEADGQYKMPGSWPGDAEPEAWYDEDGALVYEWIAQEASAAEKYKFGGTFPISVLNSDSLVLDSDPDDMSTLEVIFWGLICCVFYGGLGFWIIRRIIKRSKARKQIENNNSYFPPSIRSDGKGIKRGLTAVEAAVLLELKLDRVMNMILYGLMKKEVVQVIQQDPLKIKFTDPLPEGLNTYEKEFIRALRKEDKDGRKKLMKEAMQNLILSVHEKMDGFSVKETQDYYRSICDKAWSQVTEAETPDVQAELFEKHFGWEMLTEEPEKKIETVFSDGEFYAPSWWWRMDPTFRPGYSHSHSLHVPKTPSGKSSGSSSSGKGNTPVLPGAEFARSLTNSARSMATSMVGSMAVFRTGVAQKTNPTRTASKRSSSRGSSGGGCACACACNCAGCACACAGGGR